MKWAFLGALLVLLFAAVAATGTDQLTCGTALLDCCGEPKNTTLVDPHCESALANCTASNTTAWINYQQDEVTLHLINKEISDLFDFLYANINLYWCLNEVERPVTFDDVWDTECMHDIDVFINEPELFDGMPLLFANMMQMYSMVNLTFPEGFRNTSGFFWSADYCDGTLPYFRCRAPSNRNQYLERYAALTATTQIFPPRQVPVPGALNETNFLDLNTYCVDSMFSSSRTPYCTGAIRYADSNSGLSGLWLPYDKVSSFENDTLPYGPFPLGPLFQLDFVAVTSNFTDEPPAFPFSAWWYSSNLDALYVSKLPTDFTTVGNCSYWSFNEQKLQTTVYVFSDMQLIGLKDFFECWPIEVLALSNVDLVNVDWDRVLFPRSLQRIYLENTVTNGSDRFVIPEYAGLLDIFVPLNVTHVVLKNMTLDVNHPLCTTTLHHLQHLSLEINWIGNGTVPDYGILIDCAPNLVELYIDGLDVLEMNLACGNLSGLWPNLTTLTILNTVLSSTPDVICDGALRSLTMINVNMTHPTFMFQSVSWCIWDKFWLENVRTYNSSLVPELRFYDEGNVHIVNTDFMHNYYPAIIGQLHSIYLNNIGIFTTGPPFPDFTLFRAAYCMIVADYCDMPNCCNDYGAFVVAEDFCWYC